MKLTENQHKNSVQELWALITLSSSLGSQTGGV